MKLFDFGAFQNFKQILSHDKIIFHMLFVAFQVTPRSSRSVTFWSTLKISLWSTQCFHMKVMLHYLCFEKYCTQIQTGKNRDLWTKRQMPWSILTETWKCTLWKANDPEQNGKIFNHPGGAWPGGAWRTKTSQSLDYFEYHGPWFMDQFGRGLGDSDSFNILILNSPMGKISGQKTKNYCTNSDWAVRGLSGAWIPGQHIPNFPDSLIH